MNRGFGLLDDREETVCGLALGDLYNKYPELEKACKDVQLRVSLNTTVKKMIYDFLKERMGFWNPKVKYDQRSGRVVII